jgi:hypothetical protein
MKRSVATAQGLAGATTAEFVVATLPPLALPAEPAGGLLTAVVIDGFINYTAGTLGTQITLRVRRNSLTGTAVGPVQNVTTVAANATAIPVAALDSLVQASPPQMPGQVYVVTCQQVGSATAAGTVNYAVVTATVS